MITEAMLREAAAELNDAMLRGLPHEDECEYEFTPRFERRMKRLIRRVDHPVRYRVMRRTAAAVLVIILCAAMLLAVSPNARAAFFGWVAEQYETFTEYYFKGEINNEPDRVDYELTDLPEGFEEWRRSEDGGIVVICYENDSTGDMIHFSYTMDYNMNTYYLEKVDAEIVNITVNDDIGYYYSYHSPDTANALIWINDETGTLFCISACLGMDEMICYVENVKIVK